MQLELVAASADLFAKNHNPSILSPDWIQRNHVIEEPPETFVHTQSVSGYRSATIQMTADAERFSLGLRVVSQPNVEALQRGLCAYVNTLPHVPYEGMGLYLRWRAVAEQPSKEFEIVQRVRSAAATNLQKAFPLGTTTVGLVFENGDGEQSLRVLVEPDSEDGGTLNCSWNYRFKLGTPEKAVELSARLVEYLSKTEQSVRDLLA